MPQGGNTVTLKMIAPPYAKQVVQGGAIISRVTVRYVLSSYYTKEYGQTTSIHTFLTENGSDVM